MHCTAAVRCCQLAPCITHPNDLRRRKNRANIDPIGVGTSSLNALKSNGIHVVSVNFAKESHTLDPSGRYKVRNLRTEAY